MSETTVFENARLFDGRDTAESMHVLVEGNRIREVADHPITAADADVIDCAGRTPMPGMIDCRMHVYISSLRGSAKSALPTYYSHHASKFPTNILGCGFTTARELVGLGTCVVPTLSVMGAIMEDGRAMGIPRRNIEKLRMLRFVKRRI